MDATGSRTDGLKQRIQSGALCAVPFGSAGGGGTLHEVGPLALLVAGFAGVGVWMFRRYGSASKRPTAAPEVRTGDAPGAQVPAGA